MSNIKKTLAALAVITLSAFSVSAKTWVMNVEPIGGWTSEDENVSVTYEFYQNPKKWGAWITIPTMCEPYITTTIKNNTDDFIYLDLAKTYILRNGETELFQNQITMSTTNKNDGDASQKSLSQTVMPIPPHATKKLQFNYFTSKKVTGYEPFMFAYEFGSRISAPEYYGKKDKSIADGTILNYQFDNSPAITTISFAYSTTENTDKQIRITKDIYINRATLLKNVKPKTVDTVLPGLSNETFFTLFFWRYN